MAFKDVKTAQSNEQKTICCLVLDVSGSMNGEPIRKLNQGISEFYQQISDDETTAQRLEIAVIAFNDEITVIQQPALIDLCGNPPVLDADGTTKMVDAVREAITLIKNQKQVYKASGQTYNRPWIVLITDGEPDSGQDVSGLGKEIKAAMKNKEFVFQAIGVDDDADMKVLASISGALVQNGVAKDVPPLRLASANFPKFFKWLSASMGAVSSPKSDVDGQVGVANIPFPDWMNGYQTNP